MNIYAIGDLHLSGESPKPMDIFGDHWADHWPRIKESWQHTVSDDDIVLIPGDISWAMKLEEARCDLIAIGALPGRKIIMRGNHDYWWGSLSQVQSLLPSHMFALQNNSFVFEDCVIGGTRGWLCPGNHYFSAASDEKIYLREAGRLELSLAHARKQAPNARLIGMIHYPPSDQSGSRTLFTDIFEKYNTETVVYGHLHAGSIRGALNGKVRGVSYKLVSCDAIGFQPVKIV
jgi:predicted phosphohydrolase